MNINTAGYLQLANALLGLVIGAGLIAVGSDAGSYRVALGVFAFAIYVGAVGVGLLGRRAWARWLMLGPGLIGPLTAVIGLGLVAFGVFMLGSAQARNSGWFARSEFAMLGLWLLGLSMIVTGLVNFRLFGYLLSERGCDDFSSRETSHVGATILSLLVAAVAVFVALAGTVRIPREQVPRDLRSDAMHAADMKKEAEIQDALPRAASNLVFSDDGRRLVIVPPAAVFDLVVIDLDSGAARRPKLQSEASFRDAAQFRRVMAPDASSFVVNGHWVSLESGNATDIFEMLSVNLEWLGFHTPTRSLVRHRTDALQLLDLGARRLVYSVPANVGPYDFPAPLAWSPARDRFAWIKSDGGISTLNLESGKVRSTACTDCQSGGRLRLADDGGDGMLVLPRDPFFHPWQAQFVTGQGKVLKVEGLYGELEYFSSAGDQSWALLFTSAFHRLVFRDVMSGVQWEAELGDGVWLESVTAKRDLLIRSSRGGLDRFWLAHFEPPSEDSRLVFQEIRLVSTDPYFRTPSPDGRFLAFATLDGKIEIIDLRSMRDGAFDSRTLVIRDGSQLQSTRTDPGAERRVFSWKAARTAEQHSSPPFAP